MSAGPMTTGAGPDAGVFAGAVDGDALLTRIDGWLAPVTGPLLPDALERWAGRWLLWPHLAVGVLLLAVLAVLVAVVLGLRGAARRAPEGALVSRRAARLRTLPRYRSLRRRRRAVGAVTAVLALVTVLAAGWVAGRPGVTETEPGEAIGRDLMICLDSSGSMWDDNVLVLDAIREVVAGLRPGDRVGLTLWSGAAVHVLPLTDDLTAVTDELARAQEAFDKGSYRYVAGIDLPQRVASLIGDGLVSCARSFDRLDERRSRAVLLASDNDPLGTGVYTLPAAAQVAADDGLVVYGIGAPSLERPRNAAALAEMDAAVRATGGFLAVTGAPGADGAARTAEIVERVDALEASRSPGLTQQVRRDEPGPARALAVGAGGALLLLVLVLAVVAGLRGRPGDPGGGSSR
ncbi:VWA domain-containing protein [Nocardioides bruguierae]|uniref:VWA domain-containing protein n=1 Tax=Nocardioides bruguierae TaxID=2945102 RepID=A0A9X2DC63_9ACTN|nr:VWA domain-containing protein [Nocardioides bruguierae]MCM0621809.1 VWA domain-containing protein [Nocardioides bruguierae]